MICRSIRSRRHRLSLSILEGRDLPHGMVPHFDSGVNESVLGDNYHHYVLDSDDSMQAMGPFYIPPAQLNTDTIANSFPFGGPDGPISPNPITYTTNAAGLPLLNSDLTSPVHIFLDFDGEGSNLPYDTNGDSTTFDATEQAVIVEAWRQISVYYSMFDVNVTTVFSSPAPKVWEVISNSISGGYSSVNVFPNSSPKSYNQSGDARTRQSGIAHEIGHNFGLSHQSDYDSLGVKTAEYSSGWTLHGPIMGVDFAQYAHKFIAGHPTYSNSTLQDDLAIIATDIKAYQGVGGDGYRPDEHGNTIAAATEMEATGGYFRGWGTIERRTDADAFWFTSTGGLYDLTANGDTPSALNVKLEVFDALGTRLATVQGPNGDQFTSTSSYDREVVMDLPAGTYYMIVSGHGDYADLGAYDVNARALPAGWSSTSIGTVMANGYAGVETATGVWSVAGAGSDIWNTIDNFHYTYVSLTGDGSITARVVSMENTHADAKAGVMIRESLASNSKNAFVFLKPTSGAYFQSRNSTGGSTTSTTGTGTAPYWVRLTRTGNTMLGQVSSNGTTWTTVSSASVSMASQVLIGLAVTSHNTSQVNSLNEAVFDSLTVTGNTSTTPPSYNALPAPTNLIASLGSGTALTLVWDAVVGATGYAVDRSTNGLTWTQVTTLGSGTTTFTDTGISGGLRYFYRVAARDGSTRSIESSVVSMINRPSAPTNVTTMSVSTSSIVIDWRDTSGETGYRVERSPDGTVWSTLGTVGINVPSYTDTGLSLATTYRYRVIPLSADGDGPASTVVIESTRLPAISGLAFTAISSTSVGFQWLPVANTTGYRIDRSTDGTTYTTLATVPVVNYVDTGLTANKEYYYRVAAVNAYSESSGAAVIFAATPSTAKPPAPWESQDIGTVTGRGNTNLSGSTYTLIASGSLNSTSDSNHFMSQVLVGDGTITARVATHEDTGSTARVGVMIRESTAANSRFVSVTLAPTTGAQLLTRSTTGGSVAANISTAGIDAPYWVRLTRVGNVFTGYTSTDGTTWDALGSPVTITMTATSRAGIVNTAGTTSELNTSTLDSVTLTQGDIAPAVFSATPSGRVAGPISFVDLVFAKPMNTTSFSTANDLLSFNGPGGNLMPFVFGSSWTNSTTLRVNFLSQSVPGDYAMAFGPQILSSTNVPLDQDRDGTPGEASDGYTINFRLGGVSPDSGGYVYATTTFDAALNLNPVTAGVVTITAISNADDAAAAIDLGANVFRIHGTNYTGNNQLYVSSNGLITFGTADTTSFNNENTPAGRAIFPLWDDLRTNQDTANDDLVLYQFQDLDSNGSMDRLVISWRNVHYYSLNAATDDGFTFQAVLELNSGSKNGAITFNYVDLAEANTGATNNAGGATVGVKGSGGAATNRTVISQYSATTPEVSGNKAVKVFVNQPPTANAGGSYTLGVNGTVMLSGSASTDPDQATASLTYLWDLDGDGIYGETGGIAARGDETGISPTFNGKGLSGPSPAPVSVRVIDAFGLVSVASGTVPIPAPPTVASFVINDGVSAQRSLIQTLSVTFSGPVNLPATPGSAFVIMGSNGTIPFTTNVVGNTATLTLGALADDRYTLTIIAPSVTDGAGQELDGNGDFVGGDHATFEFHKLWGDGTGDAIVDLADFALFRGAFNAGPSMAFDANQDGNVDLGDFAYFRGQYLMTV